MQPGHAYNPDTLNRLQALLEEEIGHYRLAAEKLAVKREILVTNQPQKLLGIDQELLALSRKAAQYEKQRTQLMHELGAPNTRLEVLIHQLEPQYAGQFLRTRDRLIRAVADMERLNQENRDLLSLSLKWIQETVEIIGNVLVPEAASYDAQGGKHKTRKTNASDPIQSTVNHSA